MVVVVGGGSVVVVVTTNVVVVSSASVVGTGSVVDGVVGSGAGAILGLLFVYYINDLDPQITRSGIVRSAVNEDRYRAEFKHRFYLSGNPNKAETLSETYVDANLTWHSDSYFREDFEPKIRTRRRAGGGPTIAGSSMGEV